MVKLAHGGSLEEAADMEACPYLLLDGYMIALTERDHLHSL